MHFLLSVSYQGTRLSVNLALKHELGSGQTVLSLTVVFVTVVNNTVLSQPADDRQHHKAGTLPAHCRTLDSELEKYKQCTTNHVIQRSSF